ncbi:hypothetical protein HGM15179_019598 [Zosterops borbonicus]|uniref:RNase H type-1 domain-containing protein n=1 Tax=Zosterops borbonicus TaxID=364589 RepID=A0A8K1DB45_9PASS|nr:hypothetical protein HGM15179_019598 [Zosterops borbonicus]
MDLLSPKTYVESKMPQDQEEKNYARIWEGSRIGLFLMKTKKGAKTQSKTWEPLDNLPPPYLVPIPVQAQAPPLVPLGPMPQPMQAQAHPLEVSASMPPQASILLPLQAVQVFPLFPPPPPSQPLNLQPSQASVVQLLQVPGPQHPQQKADKWLTDARLLKYEAILIHSHDLELRTTAAQNPAQFLFGEALEKPTHNCAEVVELQTKIRPDLEEKELEEGEKRFVDRSARVLEGKRKSGYAIVDGKSGKVVESGPLSASWSAQACELYAVLRALKRLKGKKGTIFTDSKYAFEVVHTFGKIWEERGLISTRG